MRYVPYLKVGRLDCLQKSSGILDEPRSGAPESSRALSVVRGKGSEDQHMNCRFVRRIAHR
jgi:hypothetical protein